VAVDQVATATLSNSSLGLAGRSPNQVFVLIPVADADVVHRDASGSLKEKINH